MSASGNDTGAAPGRLLRMTLQVYANTKNKPEDNEAFAREYLSKVAEIHARNGMEAYQQVSSSSYIELFSNELISNP